MTDFDFKSPAELFIASPRSARRRPMIYKRFSTAAEAIRFTMEKLPAAQLVGTIMDVPQGRFDAARIRALYEQDDYPLPRRAAA